MQETFTLTATLAVAETGTAGESATSPGEGGGGATFAAPDLWAVNIDGSDDGEWGNQVFPSTQPAPNGYITANANQGRGGSRCWQAVIANENDDGFYPTGPEWPNRARVFMRWYFRTAVDGVYPSGNVKGWRFQTDGSNCGELYSNLHIALDFEPTGLFGATWYTGIYWDVADAGEVAAGVDVTAQFLADAVWHLLEMEYDRDVGPDINMRFWVDRIAVIQPAGNAPGPFDGGSAVQWSGGERRTNTPSTFRCERSADPGSVTETDSCYPFLTISQSGADATLYMDDGAVSSEEIGPCNPSQPSTPTPIRELWTNAGGGNVNIEDYASALWEFTTAQNASDLVLPAGGGSLESRSTPANENAHVRYTGSSATSDYDIIVPMLHRSGTNQLSEAYVYMQAAADSGYFVSLGNSTIALSILENSTPTGLGSSIGSLGLADNTWYRVRVGRRGNTLRAWLYDAENPGDSTNQFPITLTPVTDSTFSSGVPGVGVFRNASGQNCGVGRVIQCHNLGF